MKDEELKEILNDPKKLLDLIRAVHRLLHAYEAKELMKDKSGTNEQMGLSDDLEIKVFKGQNKAQEAKQ